MQLAYVKSLNDRIAQAEQDLQRLRQESARLGSTLSEIKTDSILAKTEDQRPAPKVETPTIAEVYIPTPPPLPSALEEPQPQKEIPAPPVTPEITPPSLPAYSAGFEMQLGRVWFVRLGIVLLTTGLVLLSSYTYKNYIHELGPGIRLGLLYLFTGMLTGVGLFCEQWKDSLKTYGRVVAAGGLAGLYYTSYAAYNVGALRVIDSPVIGSLLLILTALFCGGVSLWKNSRLMLGASLALAFYAVTLNPLGWMVGLSSLILSIGASLIARRKNWKELYFLTLAGSYFSYAIWAFTATTHQPGAEYFLIIFWLLFVSLSVVEKIPEHRAFTSANHGLFFFLYSINPVTRSWIEGHWLFCLILGSAILAIGILARKRFSKQSVLLHLIKGLGLITLGIILKLSGHHLFLTLLLESVILIALHLKIPNKFLPLASYGIAVLSVIGTQGQDAFVPTFAWVIAAALWAAFALLHRLAEKTEAHEACFASLIGFIAMFLALSLGALQDLEAWKTMLLVGGLGVVSALLQLRKIQLKLLFDLYWVSCAASGIALLGLILNEQTAAILLTGGAMAFALSFLNQRESKNTSKPTESKIHFHLGLLFFGLGLALSAMSIYFGIADSSIRMLLYLVVPILGTLLARKTRFSLHASLPFLFHLGLLEAFTFEIGPILFGLAILVGHLVILRKLGGLKDHKALENLTFLLAAGFWLSFIFYLFDDGSEPFVLAAWSSVALLLLDRLYPRKLVSSCAVPFFLTGVMGAWISAQAGGSSVGHVYFGLMAPFALHLFSCHQNRDPKHYLLGVISLLVLWLTITTENDSSGRAASWAILGTFALLTGLVCKSRPFRVTSLIILCATLGHVMLFDIIQLDPLPRILSFITLGLGLLGLGFVYNRWQDKLKQIL